MSNSDKNFVSPLHFARFEFKYILSKKKREDVEQDMRYFMHLDPFVENNENGEYLVRSLYYDDPVYTCFYDKISGIRTRSKFRIRTYPSDNKEQGSFFLEIKGRHNNLVFKHRTPLVNLENIPDLNGKMLSNSIKYHIDTNSIVYKQFSFELIRRRLEPIVIIDYFRRPYVSRFDPDFRITFDRSLSARKSSNIFIPANSTPRYGFITGYTVLEIKFRHHLPSWFHRIIQSHELNKVSISKICSGMERLGLAFDES